MSTFHAAILALTPDLILGRTYRDAQGFELKNTPILHLLQSVRALPFDFQRLPIPPNRPQYSPNNRLGNLSDELKLLQNQLIRNNNHLIHHTSGYLQTP
jgi:hypothetical protein